MSAVAITMMVVAMVALWGGLALAIWNLNRHEPGHAEEFRRDL